MRVGIVNPAGMSLQDWSAAFVYSMADTLALPQLQSEREFENWAGQIVQEPKLEPFRLPHPDTVPNWQEWAHRVNNALSTAGAY